MKHIILLVGVVSLFLTGCQEHLKIENGELPDGLIPYAEKFVGEYEGIVNGVPVSLRLALNGKKVMLSSSADWVSPGCHSTVGELREVYVRDKEGQKNLVTGVFAFSAGACSLSVWGKELKVSFGDVSPAILETKIYFYRRFLNRCLPDLPGGSNRCTEWYADYYRTSRFTKTR